MKKLLTSAVALMVATAAHAADEVRLQLQWVTQAQFAGYYVALDKGYYDAEDLDVTILPGGPVPGSMSSWSSREEKYLQNYCCQLMSTYRVSFTTKDYRGTTCRQLSSLLLLTTPIFPSGLAAYVLAKNEAESCYVVA